MSVAAAAARHSRAALLVTIALVVAGAIAAFTLPSSIYPPLQFPRIVIIARSGTLPPQSMTLTVTRPIETDTHKNVVLVPASAVVHEGEETAVFVVENEMAKRREVKTGIENSDRVEIISGVKPGEMVITSGQNGLPDGAKVTLAARDEK